MTPAIAKKRRRPTKAERIRAAEAALVATADKVCREFRIGMSLRDAGDDMMRAALKLWEVRHGR